MRINIHSIDDDWFVACSTLDQLVNGTHELVGLFQMTLLTCYIWMCNSIFFAIELVEFYT